MAHHRIRKFNTGDTYPEQNLDNDLCQAVVTQGGKTVWMRGQCPQNLDDAKNIDSHDPAEQTHKVMRNISQLVTEAGGEMAHVVKLVVYITDIRHREAVYRTMGEYIKGIRSARALSYRRSQGQNGWWKSTPPPSFPTRTEE